MLKKNLLICLLIGLVYFPATQAQIFVIDSFTDGNLNIKPEWFGDTSKFEVNTSNQLQLNDATASSPAFLVTSSNIINNAEWKFWMRMEFPPSGSNYGTVYLVSDVQNLSQNVNGYFVQIGGVSGTVDDVSLYRQDGSSNTKLIDGTDGTVGLAPVDIKIKVTKDSLGEWELFIDTSAAKNNYISQGTATDLTYSQSNYFGFLCNYTSTRSDKFFFDNIHLQGEAFQDTIKPSISNLNVLDSNTLELTFSEKVEQTTALNPSNYKVNKSFGNPTAVSYPGNDSSIVNLSFSNNFGNGIEYYLTVENVADKSNNIMETDSFPFLYFKAVPADYRDIVINEFYPDFSPSLGLAEAEFVEIYNASNKVFDLENWSISDESSTTTLNSHILRPGKYLILCAQSDLANFQNYGSALGLSSLPTLNNDGDLIQIRDDNNQVIDELTYDLSWYKDQSKTDGGWTIEQINPFTNCTGKNNFKASTASIGGTPGTQNTAFDTLPDTTAPVLLNAEVISTDSVLLHFNERLDTNSVLSANYSFNTTVVVDQIINLKPNYSSVLLTLIDGLDSSQVNTLTVTSLRDCPGNLIGTTNSVDIVISGTPVYRDVVINEIFADPSPVVGSPEAEFIELYNASDQIFDLNNWSISDNTLQSSILMPGDYIIICPSEHKSDFEMLGATQGLSTFPSLVNSGDEIFLRDLNGKLVDYVNYEESWYKNGSKSDGGWTLEQINPQLACSGSYNFTSSVSQSGGTPGKQNSVLDLSPDITQPILKDVLVYSEDSLKLVFNKGIDSTSVDFFDFNFSNNNEVDTILFDELNLNSFIILLNSALDSGEFVNMTIENITDCSGNKIADNTKYVFALPETANEFDLVINEILFNPRTGGSDFVELYNRSDKIISLQNWKLGNRDNEQINVITEEPYLIFPKEYVFITTDGSSTQQEYPAAQMDRLLEVSSMSSFNNDDGIPYTLNEKGKQIDQISYHEDMHFELLRDVKGVSLERINPHLPSEDQSNFHSAAKSVNYATPGYQNSQYSLSTNFKGTVNLDPETFSPDNDGYQDWLNINYQFPESGNVANVKIYDRQGRLIKELIKNELLAKSGTFKWDGITEDNNKARIGVYVIYFEVFNPNGEQKVYKKTAVVAGYLD